MKSWGAAFVLSLCSSTAMAACPSGSTCSLGLPSVATNAALKAAAGGFSQYIQRAGYYAAGDGGDALYYWNSTSSCTDDGGSCIVPNSAPSSGRWILAHAAAHAACPSILIFGGLGDGVTDNSAAFNAALHAYQNPCVYFPSGDYNFLSSIGYTFPVNGQSLMVKGDGKDITELTWPNAVSVGFVIALIGQSNSVQIRDMSISTGQAGADIGIEVNQTVACSAQCASGSGVGSDFTNLVFRGNDGYYEQTHHSISHFWNTGIYIQNASYVNFNNIFVQGKSPLASNPYADTTSGSGVTLAGTGGNPTPVAFNFANNCNFQGLTNGILIGPYTQGVNVSQGVFTGNYSGIGVPPGNSATGISNLAVVNSYFDDQQDILVGSIITAVNVANNLFIATDPHTGNKYGIQTNVQSNGLNITGNTFYGINTGADYGVSLNNTASADITPAVITGNIFSGQLYGAVLGTGTKGNLLASNRYYNNTNNYSDAGTSNQIGVAVP